MKRRRGKHLSEEDRHLWNRVASTTTPLSAERGRFLKDQMARLMDETATAPSSSHGLSKKRQKLPDFQIKPGPQAPPTVKGHQHHPIDKPVLKKLARGRVSIDSRIDLHGMTQDRARYALMDFLQMAHRSGHRIVLVITGKGNEGQGVLRRNVPLWLRQPVFASLVNGIDTAHASHGGEGALYVRLRRSATRRGDL